MNKKLLKEWLVEYKDTVGQNQKGDFYYELPYSEEVQILSRKLQNDEIKNFQDLKISVSKLMNEGALLRKPIADYFKHYDFEDYPKKFRHLLDINLPIIERINAAISSTSYELKDFSIEQISNLVAYNEPRKYIPVDTDSHIFIYQLELEDIILKKQQSNTYGAFFKAFNDVIKEEILEPYCEVFYNKKSDEITEKDLHSEISLMYEVGCFYFNKIMDYYWEQGHKFEKGFVSGFSIFKFYSINQEKIRLNNLEDKKFIFLLGENGTGKTVLLKAILLALKKNFIKDYTSKEETGIIFQVLDENKKAELEVSIFKKTNELTYSFDEFNRFYLANCYAYGTQRNKISHGSKAEPYGFLSLFQPNQFMTNVGDFLLNIERKELKGKKTIGIQGIEKILGHILDYPNLKILIKEIGIGEVFFKLDEREYKLHQLSEGYQTIMIFVVDLLSRLSLNNPTITETKDFKAVVLIDELDLFLHPKWQKNICGKLHEIFPNIQFFVTTHSPILVDGAVKDKRIDNTAISIFKLDLKDGATYIERAYTGDLIEDWTPNLLINSDLFDNDYLNDLDEAQVKELRSNKNEAELLKIGKSLKVLKNKSEELKERYLQSLKNN